MIEDEDENPWEPFHLERGFRREQSTVTVFGTIDVIHNANYQRSAEQLLLGWAGPRRPGGTTRRTPATWSSMPPTSPCSCARTMPVT